jgi:hypothetical protein
MFFFNSPFDEHIDDYPDHYQVWRLPVLTSDQSSGTWIGLPSLAVERLPNIGLQELPFEVPRRGVHAQAHTRTADGTDV